MIKDIIKNADTYYMISDRLKKGFEWIKNNDLECISDGRYEIDSDKIYVNIQTYMTKEDAKYEAHRRYIDIQYIIKGEEIIGVASKCVCQNITEYDYTKDIEFMNCSGSENAIIMQEGEFMVLFPQDAHRPSIRTDKQKIVKKAVVKVATA